MRSPWRSLEDLDPDREYFVFASWIPARRYGATPRLFRGAKAVGDQLEETPGLVGFSLLARPVRKQYATLSMWQDEASLTAFASAAPHRQLMGELAPEMGETRFLSWTVTGAQGRPRWREALRRLRGGTSS